MPTARFQALQAQVTRLGGTYLNFAAKVSGNYTFNELSQASAYTIFVHAELEHYLESSAKCILARAEKKWIGKARASRPLVSLTAAYTKMATPEAVPGNDIWSAPVIDAVKKHENAISNNNGIKTKHFCKLFVPLGFDVRTVDPILLSELDTFGAMRGGEAHSTHRSNILKNYDPFLRRTKALGIVGLLATFDNDLAAFIKSV